MVVPVWQAQVIRLMAFLCLVCMRVPSRLCRSLLGMMDVVCWAVGERIYVGVMSPSSHRVLSALW